MSYWLRSPKDTRPQDSYGLATSHTTGQGGNREFHELEFGVVLDVVLDLKHPIYSGAHPMQTQIDTERWPVDLTGAPPAQGDPDLTWIGRALVRPLVSGKIVEKDQLKWAYPLENNFTEYPLINETVILYEEGGQMFYSRKVNFRNWPNNNLDFTIEGAIAGGSVTELFSKAPFTGRIQTNTDWKADSGYHGYAGKYFYGNPKIRTLHRFEGDLLLESRHGSEVIMKAFDKNRGNDVGDPKYPDYKDGGNPMLILRNRQRQLLKVGQTLSLKHSPNLATVVGTIEEKNVGGYLDENINHDGSSVYMTCGQTISEWVTTCYKRMFHDEKDEEVAKFKGPSTFVFPNPMKGDQIVVNSDRLLFSSRYEEILSYSKKRYGICTDNEFTVDAHQQMVFTTHTKIVLNSPAIYLGEYDKTDEPVLLGQTTVNLLWDFLEMFKQHVHKHEHSHVDAGDPSPHMTQEPTDPFVAQATALQVRLKSLLSRRVYVTGGGFAPGQNGASIPEGTPPVQIDVGSGAGAPGGFKGQSHRFLNHIYTHMKKSELTQLTQIIEVLVTREIRKQLPKLIGEVFQSMAGKSMVTERVVHTAPLERKDYIAKEIEDATIKPDPHEFRASLKELFAGATPVTRAELEEGIELPPPRKIIQYAKDPVLNQILNETTPDLNQRERQTGLAAFHGGYNPGIPATGPGPMMPPTPANRPIVPREGQDAPLAAIPEGVSALDVARAGVAPPAVTEALTNYDRMKKILEASKGKRY